MAGSSFGSCGTSFPRMARSRILDLVCLILADKSSVSFSKVSTKVNHCSTALTILSCSSIGATGIIKDNSNSLFKPGISPLAFAIISDILEAIHRDIQLIAN